MGSAAWLPNSGDCHKIEITKQSKITYQIKSGGDRWEGSVVCLVLWRLPEDAPSLTFVDGLGIASPLPFLSDLLSCFPASPEALNVSFGNNINPWFLKKSEFSHVFWRTLRNSFPHLLQIHLGWPAYTHWTRSIEQKLLNEGVTLKEWNVLFVSVGKTGPELLHANSLLGNQSIIAVMSPSLRPSVFLSQNYLWEPCARSCKKAGLISWYL